jgi:hypothetical protein
MMCALPIPKLNPIILEILSNLLPEGFSWGDPLTPDDLFQIIVGWDEVRNRASAEIGRHSGEQDK